MSASSLQRRFAILAAFAFFAASHKAPLLAVQTGVQDSSLHIGVVVQDHMGKPISYLSAKNFALSSQGIPLSFKLVRPALNPKPSSKAYEPTRMLILLSPYIKNSAATLNRLLPELDPLWQRGWQIAAVLSTGSRTDYATSAAQLQQMWIASNNSAHPLTGPKSAPSVAAIHDLNSFSGRRVVLYLAKTRDQQARPTKQIASAAKQSMAQLFVVNGGDVVWEPGPVSDCSNNNPSLFGGPAAARSAQSSTPPAYRSNCLGSYTKVSKQDDGYQFIATNAHTAIREALREAQSYYSLQIQNASPQNLPPGSPLSLEIHVTGTPNYTATALAYGKNNPPQITLTKK
jgi:hypothetical protein